MPRLIARIPCRGALQSPEMAKITLAKRSDNAKKVAAIDSVDDITILSSTVYICVVALALNMAL